MLYALLSKTMPFEAESAKDRYSELYTLPHPFHTPSTPLPQPFLNPSSTLPSSTLPQHFLNPSSPLLQPLLTTSSIPPHPFLNPSSPLPYPFLTSLTDHVLYLLDFHFGCRDAMMSIVKGRIDLSGEEVYYYLPYIPTSIQLYTYIYIYRFIFIHSYISLFLSLSIYIYIFISEYSSST